jgi:UDP-N-acetylglucosamine--N-acetylmuramyl-(pentapeptide) pyrophosphoryl-undecaprenol N-acetylglucosamine transferase
VKSGKKIIISGGGTGGHIFPAIAIANALKKLDPTTEILFVGALGRMEMEKVPAAGYEIIGLDIRGIQRGSIVKNLQFPIKLIGSLRKALKIIKDFKPNAVVGVGAMHRGRYYMRHL